MNFAQKNYCLGVGYKKLIALRLTPTQRRKLRPPQRLQSVAGALGVTWNPWDARRLSKYIKYELSKIADLISYIM